MKWLRDNRVNHGRITGIIKGKLRKLRIVKKERNRRGQEVF